MTVINHFHGKCRTRVNFRIFHTVEKSWRTNPLNLVLSAKTLWVVRSGIFARKWVFLAEEWGQKNCLNVVNQQAWKKIKSLTECPRKRQKGSEMENRGFWRNLAGLTHPWVGLTSQNSFGLGSTQWAWEPRPKFRVTNKINILSCCSNFKILLNLSFWICLKKFGSKRFFGPPTGSALWQKNSLCWFY